ncbi:MAG: hypothetical protein HY787_07505 [Deltaproteobacteria bacterium]|nr:hypothetical protein [Deltaproteobacteria bacterium]
MRKVHGLLKGFMAIVFWAVFFLSCQGTAEASGPFGPPRSLSRGEGGLATAIGYWRNESDYQIGRDRTFRQNQIYSQLGYGNKNWEIYGRIGFSDLKISEAFRGDPDSAIISKNDFEDQWIWFGTLGAKGFYPFNRAFGIGAFIQGSYFKDFNDRVSGTFADIPFAAQVKVENLWDANFGLGLQITSFPRIKFYLGPYVRYSEARLASSAPIPGLVSNAGSQRIPEGWHLGGYAGISLPLGRGFHLNIEGRYSERFSAGAAVVYTY